MPGAKDCNTLVRFTKVHHLQSFIFVGADDRLVLVRAVPRHLPPALRFRDGRLPESTQGPLVRNYRVVIQ